MMDQLTGQSNPDIELATPIAVGGALTTSECRLAYAGQLGVDPFLPAEERFFPNPRDNVRHHTETFKRLESFAEGVYEKSNGRLVVVGHSFGGLMAVKLGLKRPDIVAAVKSEAGLQDGYRGTIGVRAVKLLVGDAEDADDAKHDSAHINELHEEIASEWSPDVSLSLHSALFDVCFPLPQGLGIELPSGQRPSRKIVAPNLPFFMQTLRLMIPDIPSDTEILPSLYCTEHILLPAADAEVNHTLELRRSVAAAEPAKTVKGSFTPAAEPQLALAA